jgi:Na+/H+-dicarboxylate symporter
MYTFILAISLLKAYLFYLLIQLIQKLDLSKPFNGFVSGQITQVSYLTLAIGLLSAIAQSTTKNLLEQGFDIDRLNKFWADSEAFILMSAIIYIIATIIKRGVEIQNENDLTV